MITPKVREGSQLQTRIQSEAFRPKAAATCETTQEQKT